ncbi:hypothetical protein BU17DRAFT_101596 [Hysterangium stoloniferum]|nr:hypothetical protein BU17DRAFT_101596 [Hysterangium stoloniferum]
MRTRSANGVLLPVSYEELPDIDSDNRAWPRVPSMTRCDELDASPPKKARYSNSIPPVRDHGSTPMRLAHRGRNAGKLAKLLEMPMDIFYEVCSHVEPVDLLHVARTSKHFHTMLMSRESKPLWRAARSNCVGLPDCPSDISEATYARLLFEKDCHECLAPRTLKVDFVLRSRLCRLCRKLLLVSGEELLEKVPGFTEELLDCVPSAFVLEAFFQDLERNRKHGTFRKDQVNALLDRLREAVSPNLPEEEAKVAKIKFIAKEVASVKTIVKHTREISNWIYLNYKAKSAAETETSKKRKSEIYTKLNELGYNEEDFPNTRAWHKLTEQPKELTSRTWKTLRPKLEDILQEFKKQRDETARKTREARRRLELATYISQLLQEREDTNRQLYMNLQDAFALPTAESLITDEDDEQGITVEKWEANKIQIITEMDDYAERIRVELKELISHSQLRPPSLVDGFVMNPLKASDIDDTFLASPSTQFECSVCDKSVQYPGMLKHAHNWTARWSTKAFRFSPTKTTIAQALVSFMGRFTAHSVVVHGRIFQCLRCENKISHPMEWSELVQHFELAQVWHKSTPYHDHSLGRAEGPDRPLVIPLTLEQVSRQRTKVHCRPPKAGKERKDCEICLVWGKWIPQNKGRPQAAPFDSLSESSIAVVADPLPPSYDGNL